MKLILAKLHAIMSELNYLEKDKFNAFHKYRYTSDEAVKAAVHDLLVKHKVFFQLESDNARTEGKLTLVDITYRFIDIESGESLAGKFQGSGEDSTDKGLYKALTGATKYIMFSNFVIPTGDDPEESTKGGKKPKTATQSDEQVAPIDVVKGQIRDRLLAMGVKTKTRLRALFKQAGFEWESLDGHTEIEYKTLLAKLIQLSSNNQDAGNTH